MVLLAPSQITTLGVIISVIIMLHVHNIMFLFVQMTLVTNEDHFHATKLNAPWEKQDNGDLSGMTYENKQEEDENYSGQSV